MLTELKRGVLFTLVTMVLFGGVYHAGLWAVGQVAFPAQAQGSTIRRDDGSVIGSSLVAQAFARPGYFHPRPSAVDYNAASTGGSNFGPSNLTSSAPPCRFFSISRSIFHEPPIFLNLTSSDLSESLAVIVPVAVVFVPSAAFAPADSVTWNCSSASKAVSPATFTVIVSFLPMFFITGMMGPYMAPMAFNVPVAMLLSLVVAFTVTPWAAYHLLRGHAGGPQEAPFDVRSSGAYRAYRGRIDWQPR